MLDLYSWFMAHGIKIILILIGALIINKVGKKFISKATERGIKDTDEEATKKRQETLIRIFTGTLKVIVWLAAILMTLSELDINVGPILAGAGILGVALGFGAQYMVRDFLAGLFIILENQYRIGDWVVIGKVSGEVERVTLRKTVLRDRDGAEHHIPNGEIKQASNLAKGFGNLNLNVNVAYKEDLDKVINVLNKLGNEVAEDAEWKDKIIEAPQVLGVDDFADSAVVLRIWGKTTSLNQWSLARELRKRIKIAFDKEGIEIPFPQMSVWPKGKWEK